MLISSLPLDVLLPRMREPGMAPVVEGPDGVVRVGAAEGLRARTPRSREPAGGARGVARQAAHVATAVRTIRQGDEDARNRPASASAPGGGVLSALRDAVERRGAVLIGFTDNQGVVSERAVRPLVVDGGQAHRARRGRGRRRPGRRAALRRAPDHPGGPGRLLTHELWEMAPRDAAGGRHQPHLAVPFPAVRGAISRTSWCT
ncbi:hypothetical protein G5V59_22450 [Nocardioides sp. W3-2-3]|uniref:hypothetical protein n=1 Tax=Nocardioides convexus TaxID=2712224 RepID=UPI002418A940|nr:hypothetical protein [Nocardioides convexus]NHA01599.1 hypothetical protein [Nocardioides convexus]